MKTGYNEAPNPFHEFLTGRIPSRTALNQSNCNHNDSLDTTLAAPERKTPVAVQDPIRRLADVLTHFQNRPTAQQPLTIRPVNTTTMTFDGKNEKN